jgi:hypothetical protein
LQKLEKRA